MVGVGMRDHFGHHASPYILNHIGEWQERLDTWPRVTMENLAKQSVADEQEGGKMIVVILL